MDTCQFTYISRDDFMPKRAMGIERSWEELKEELDRTGPACYPGAIYFKTISVTGPQLFAVVNDNSVFYHEGGHWYRYVTAFDIKFGTMSSEDPNPPRATAKKVNNEADWNFLSRDQ